VEAQQKELEILQESLVGCANGLGEAMQRMGNSQVRVGGGYEKVQDYIETMVGPTMRGWLDMAQDQLEEVEDADELHISLKQDKLYPATKTSLHRDNCSCVPLRHPHPLPRKPHTSNRGTIYSERWRAK
jgi:hypothetical protein